MKNTNFILIGVLLCFIAVLPSIKFGDVVSAYSNDKVLTVGFLFIFIGLAEYFANRISQFSNCLWKKITFTAIASVIVSGPVWDAPLIILIPIFSIIFAWIFIFSEKI